VSPAGKKKKNKTTGGGRARKNLSFGRGDRFRKGVLECVLVAGWSHPTSRAGGGNLNPSKIRHNGGLSFFGFLGVCCVLCCFLFILFCLYVVFFDQFALYSSQWRRVPKPE